MSSNLIIAGCEVQARLLRNKHPDADVQTFHAWITGLLSQHGSHVGLRPDLYVATSSEDRRALTARARSRKERVDLGILTAEDARWFTRALVKKVPGVKRLLSAGYQHVQYDQTAWRDFMLLYELFSIHAEVK